MAVRADVIFKVAAVATGLAGAVLIGRATVETVQPVVSDGVCKRGDDAVAAAAAGQLAVLVRARVAGADASRDAARGLGAEPEVVKEFGRWAEQEDPAFRHALFGATAVKVQRRDGDRVAVAVDGYWLRSADSVSGPGEFVNALWTMWMVWRDGRWVPSSPPEAATLPGGHTHKALPFLRNQAGFSGVPYVHC